MNFFCKSLALALLVSLHSSAHAAAERRLQIGFATISPVIAPLWVAVARCTSWEGLRPAGSREGSFMNTMQQQINGPRRSRWHSPLIMSR